MNSYKNIGICYQNLCNYSIALIYFGKMLRLAWYLKDIDSELKAYDFIGIQFFYSGQLDKAKYYHNKMIHGNLEPENSELKKLGI